jgi:CDP-diacylglycerol--glycerol-3-phosphate 3-phosphatidyltransferase
VLNIANGLTGVRIVLIPVFALLVVASGMTDRHLRMGACVAFFVASLTDFVDGWIARTWDLVTSFGKVADPIADKALTGTALLLLSAYGRLAWWVTGLILLRELGVTALRFWVLRHGVIPASRGGKVKTALQILAIVWYLWPFGGWLVGVGSWLMIMAVVVTVGTGVDYVLRALRLRRAGLAAARDLLVMPNSATSAPASAGSVPVSGAGAGAGAGAEAAAAESGAAAAGPIIAPASSPGASPAPADEAAA